MTARSTTPDSLPAASLSSIWRGPALALGYGAAWLLLLWFSHLLWFLPAGLRLGALWLAPQARWRWLALGEWSAMLVLAGINDWTLDLAFAGVGLVPWLIYAGVVRLARGTGEAPPVDDPRGMLMLIASGMFSAALVSPILQHFQPDLASGHSGMAGVFAFLYGDFIGQLVLAPLLALALRGRRFRVRRSMLYDIGLQLAFALGVFWLVRQRVDLAPYILLLAFAPIFFVSFRQGWEGAAISVALVGLVIEGLLRLGMMPVDMSVLQLALAVVGGGGLVLGAASTQLRHGHQRLAARHRDLAEANRSLKEAASELRSVSQRLVRLEEQGQRELAVELDYEIGQSIHALSTRISLAFRDVRDEQMLRLLESMREQVREMQDSLRRVLRQLRPQVLDTHGLREAVGFGPLRDMLEDAGIAYEASFGGNVEALNDDARTTVYRICQAAVRDASRSESIRRLRARVDVAPGGMRRLEVRIQIDIEASPFLEFPIEPHPLDSITDRVLAQQGSYSVQALAPGVRHIVLFEEDDTHVL